VAEHPSTDGLTLRPATANDMPVIKRLVRSEGLDPTQLRWSNFLIAEMDGVVAGIGQIRQHRNCRELGSLVVTGDYRRRGVATALMRALEARAGRPLYLLCAHPKQSFYERFGFHVIGYCETPGVLRLKRTVGLLGRLMGVRVLAMRKD
jgi:amino-acid N-acetyltransferase